MREAVCSAVVLSVLLSAGCSTLTVRTSTAKYVDLASYRTFNFYDLEDPDTDPVYFNPVNRERFQSAIAAALEERGYVRAPDPGLLIALYLKVQDKQRVITYPDYYGGPHYYGMHPGYSFAWVGTSVVDYKLGTLIIDVADAADQRLVWQGVIEDEFLESDKVTDRDIRRAVAKVFGKFPPRRP